MTLTSAQATRFDPLARAIHWLTLLLIGAIYTVAWTAHSGLAGEWYRPVMELHRSLGLTVFAVTLCRLAWRWRTRAPRLPEDLHPLQRYAARSTQVLLYVLLIAQPTLGLLQTSARGQGVAFYFLVRLPAVIDTDRALARQLHGLHVLGADALLVLIAAHSAAALFHHFIRRDDVLNAMLPARLHDFGRSTFALMRPRRQT